MNVLAIGAHPDDIEIGCGGTLLRHIDNGDEVHTLILTGGEGGSSPPRYRRAEAIKAADMMRVNSIRFGHISALEMCYVRQAFVEVIEEMIHEVMPDRVYCHSEHDLHQNHVTASRCSLIAAKQIREVFSFRLPSKTNDFRPTYYVDISEMIDRKVECVSAFKSQASKEYMRERWIRGVALSYAIEARMGGDNPAAEAFFVERMIW